ncbi:hypothetical protein, partial [Xanthomonas sacchari]|uniref:hypothetical protein n=1 Tax=Xanthomonas sacchari TaxID=56458 RepID=UPI00225A63A6
MQLQVVAGLQGQVVADGQAGAIAVVQLPPLACACGGLQNQVTPGLQRGAVACLECGSGEADVAP